MEKRGQITIFIIIAVLLISGVALFFVFRSGVIPGIGGKAEVSSSAFLSTCIEDKVREAVRELSLRGGYLDEPNSVNFMFVEEGVARDITYLCSTLNNFNPCLNQKVGFKNDFKENIKDYISEDFETCFTQMKSSFERQGFEVNPRSGLTSFEVDLAPKRITIQTVSKVTLTKSGETSTEKNFEVPINSKMYEILNVVEEIVNQEATFCYFETGGFLLVNPEFIIDHYGPMDEGTEIYTVGHEDTGEKFRFAVRGCTSPQGY